MATPLTLKKVTIDGPFPSIVSLDDNWSEIEAYCTDLAVQQEGLADTFSDFISSGYLGYFAEFTSANFESVSSYSYLFPPPSTWDELEFHIELRGAGIGSPGMRVSSDGGDNWLSGSSDYTMSVNGGTATTGNSGVFGNASATIPGATTTHITMRHFKRVAYSGVFQADIIYDRMLGETGILTNRVNILGPAGESINAIQLRGVGSYGNISGRMAVYRRKYAPAS